MHKHSVGMAVLFVSLTVSGHVLAQSDVIATIPVGAGPHQVDITPNGSKAYVVNRDSDTVSVIDTASNLVIKTVPVGDEPHSVEVSPNGQEAWVTNRLSGTVSVIAIPTDTVVSTIGLGGLVDDVTFTPDGNRAYVVSDEVGGSVTLSIIDVGTRTVVDAVVTNIPQEGIEFSPDGALGYLGLHLSSGGGLPIATRVFNVSTKAEALLINDVWIRLVTPDGTRGWGINPFTNVVDLVNLNDGTVLSSVSVAAVPNRSLVLTPDGSRLYVANNLSDIVTVIDTNTKTILETIPFAPGSQPVGIDMTPDGIRVYVTNLGNGTVSVLGFGLSVLEITIDVKPGAFPNCFKLDGNGVIPVAILGSADLDVRDIRTSLLSFGGLAVRVRGNGHPSCATEYSNGDEFLDLVCHFEDEPASWRGGSDTAEVMGSLINGTPFQGTDSICIIP